MIDFSGQCLALAGKHKLGALQHFRPMNQENDVTLFTLVDRLAKMEGLLTGLQNSIVQGQMQTSAFMGRVERLEQRQVELEKQQVTKDDFKELSGKVDNLIQSEARQSGSLGIANWSISQLATWAAVIIACLALVGVGASREAIKLELQQKGISR